MPISKRLAMSEDQLTDLMMNTWNMRIATIGPGVEINLTPMWFGWAEGKIFTYGRGQKVVNVRRNPVCSIIVDRNERFPELQAAMFQGRARVLETAAEEEAEPGMDIVREQMGVKYAGGHGEPKTAVATPNRASARGETARWIVFTPNKQITWDNFKLPRAGG